MDAKEWARLLRATEEVNEFFEEDIAFIGGIAVYAYAMEQRDFKRLAVFSHDADFVILLHAFTDLRDLEVVTPNKRLGKQQFEKDGFEFDVYVQHQTNLRLSVEEMVAGSTTKSGLRVASLEHLVLLKLDAFEDRQGSQKGEKDAQDLIRILYLMKDPDETMLERLTHDDIALIDSAIALENVLPIVEGNRHMAKPLKAKVDSTREKLAAIVRRKDHDEPEP